MVHLVEEKGKREPARQIRTGFIITEGDRIGSAVYDV
jgi:hypothetical protein